METVAVLDFETTGLYAAWGDRATEIAIVLVRDERIVDRYTSLMNAGKRISPEITYLTGITNEMVSSAPAAEKVMREAARFVGKHGIVAHNASFDKKFWESELQRCGITPAHRFACTMLVSRRVYPEAPNHKLGTLANMLKLSSSGRAHRAMADAEMASQLLSRIQKDLAAAYGLTRVNYETISCLQKISAKQAPRFLRHLAQ